MRGGEIVAAGTLAEVEANSRSLTGKYLTGELSIAVPTGWTSVVSGGSENSKTLADPIAPGATASATFKVISGPAAFNGDLIASAQVTSPRTGPCEGSARVT